MRIFVSRKRLLALTHDLGMTVAAVYLAYYMLFADIGLGGRLDDIAIVSAILVPLAALVYVSFGLYDGIWRFSSLSDFRNILKSVATLTVVLALVDFASRGHVLVPREVVAAYFVILGLLLGLPRLLYRSYREHRTQVRGRRHQRRVPVLVAGTGYDAEIIIRALETYLGGRYRPVALLTTKRSQIGHRIRTIPILGHVGELESVFRRVSRGGATPQRLIVTNEALRREPAIEDAIVQARRLGLQAERLMRPGDTGAMGDQVQIAPIEIEDLLGREMYRLDTDLIRRLVQGRRILVTGGGGSIGGELCRQIAAMDCAQLTVVEKSERPLVAIENDLREARRDLDVEGLICDVRDRKAIFAVVERLRPEIVFHAAALKHVPIVEAHVREGVRTNVGGTRNVADACQAAGVGAMVMISTDKAVRPTSVMGATKRAAESYCEALDELQRSDGSGARETATRFLSVRFGNVLGSSGSVVPLFTQQLRKGGPLTVTHQDMKRYFMTISEAVSLVLMASAHGFERRERSTIYVLDMGEPVKIVDLAERMIRLAGMKPGIDIQIEFTGMRPGEKLYEELFLGNERLHPTDLQGILVAEPQPVAPQLVISRIEHLCERAPTASDAELVGLLEELVPEYDRAPAPASALPPLEPAAS